MESFKLNCLGAQRNIHVSLSSSGSANTHVPLCNFGMPCRHVLFARSQAGVPLFSSTNFHTR